MLSFIVSRRYCRQSYARFLASRLHAKSKAKSQGDLDAQRWRDEAPYRWSLCCITGSVSTWIAIKRSIECGSYLRLWLPVRSSFDDVVV